MSRFLCFGDIHLDSGRDYATDRLQDQENVLNQILDIVDSRAIDAVLFAGDLYHKPHPSNAARHVFRRFTDQLRQREIVMLCINGNAGHDLEAADRPTALELHASEMVYVSRTPEVVTVAGVAVCTLPSIPMSRLFTDHDLDQREQLIENAGDLLARVAQDLADQVPDGIPRILLGHWSVTGAGLPTGLSTSDLHEPVIPLPELERARFDAIVLGHIHKPQEFAVDGRDIFYTGSPNIVSFGEEHVEHGCWILTLGETLEFVPLHDRPFVTIDADLTDAGDLTERVLTDAVEAVTVERAVVRVRYRATAEQHRRVNQAALKTHLRDDLGAHRVYQIVPDIVRDTRTRTDAITDDTSPVDAVREWAAVNKIDDDLTDRVADITSRLLEQVPA